MSNELPRLKGVLVGLLAQFLATVCGIDLSDRFTPGGTAFRSAVAAVATDVIRDDAAGCALLPAALRALLGPVPV